MSPLTSGYESMMQLCQIGMNCIRTRLLFEMIDHAGKWQEFYEVWNPKTCKIVEANYLTIC